MEYNDESIDELFYPNTEIEESDDQSDEVSDEVSDEQSVEVSDEQPVEVSDEGEQQSKKQDTVPFARFEAERNKLKSRLEEERQERDRLQEEIRQIREEMAQQLNPKEPPPEPPSYEEDPAEYLRQQTEQLRNQQQEQSEQLKQWQNQAQARNQINELMQGLTQAESEFMQTHDDYKDALARVREDATNRLNLMPDAVIDANIQQSAQLMQMMGMGAPTGKSQKIQALIALQEIQTSAQLLQNGVNPAEYVYNIGKQLGYRPAEGAEQKPSKLDKISKGMRESKSVASGGAARGTQADVTVDSLLDELMSGN